MGVRCVRFDIKRVGVGASTYRACGCTLLFRGTNLSTHRREVTHFEVRHTYSAHQYDGSVRSAYLACSNEGERACTMDELRAETNACKRQLVEADAQAVRTRKRLALGVASAARFQLSYAQIITVMLEGTLRPFCSKLRDMLRSRWGARRSRFVEPNRGLRGG